VKSVESVLEMDVSMRWKKGCIILITKKRGTERSEGAGGKNWNDMIHKETRKKMNKKGIRKDKELVGQTHTWIMVHPSINFSVLPPNPLFSSSLHLEPIE
jgi:hypothetical protein